MRIVTAALTAVAFAFLSLTVVQAEDQKKPTGAQLADAHAKVEIANGLITLGRANKDPMMLLVAARLLTDLDASVVDPASAAGDRTTYDVAEILDEARSFATGDQALLDRIAGVPDVRGERKGERAYCLWEYECAATGCDYYYNCHYDD